MKILVKFEHFLNRIITKVQLWALRIISILIPPFIKRLYARLAKFISEKMIKLIELSKKLRFVPQIISQKMTTLQKSFNTSQNLGLKDKILNNTIRKPMALHLKSCLSLFGRIKDFFVRLITNPKDMLSAIGVVCICFGVYTIINSSSDIYMREFPLRAPASIPSTKKPEYSKYQKRTMKVLNIQLPVIYKGVNDLHSVNVDFTVRTSSRFAKKFLENYEYKLKDHFFSTVEPVISSFAIQNEGKDVLEAKIKYELQEFLKQNRVEGDVLEINTISIIAN